jgi:hypothetical protein
MPICKNCGNTSQSNRSNPVFWWRSCHDHYGSRDAARHLEYTCLYCGKQYRPKSKERNKYCSRECRFNHQHEFKARRLEYLEKARLENQQINNQNCSICGKSYHAQTGCFCSDDCRKESARRKNKAFQLRQYKPSMIVCKECNSSFVTQYADKRKIFCSNKCHDQYTDRMHPERKADLNHRRRARLHGCKNVRVNRQSIFERDGWICQLCHKSVNKNLKNPYLKSATLDHIIPLALGGAHEPSNCQLAHMICNSKKRDLAQGQLILMG